jgi:hypothetical protein
MRRAAQSNQEQQAANRFHTMHADTPERCNYLRTTRVLTLEAEAVDFSLPGCAPWPAPEGNRVHLCRGHLTLLARKVGFALGRWKRWRLDRCPA